RRLVPDGFRAVASGDSEDMSPEDVDAFWGAMNRDITSALRDEATRPQLVRLRYCFKALAAATMDAAQSTMHGGSTATSWLSR
ncbi:MAG: hypothetical protein ABUL47_00625, partial [Leifsonia sp.]